MCVWPVYIYHRATWDMSVQSIVLPHPTVLVEFCDSHSFPWVMHMHGKTVLQVVFWAACCTACGPEGSAVLHQHVLWVRRAWISFCLQPLIQSHWKGSVWGLSYVRHWKVDVLLVWHQRLSAGKQTIKGSVQLPATVSPKQSFSSQLSCKIVPKWA